MKIVEIDIHGFGQLSQMQLSLGAPFVVIYGKNESGKSTLFQFIHTMLFGFSRKRDTTKYLAPVYGGHHGGSLIIETRDHEFVKLTRFKEQHQGKAQVTIMEWDESKEKLIPSGQATIMDQSQLEKNYFDNVSSRLFQQVSTISLGELQATSVMNEKELSQYLYHASWESGKYVAELDRELTERQEKLFKPRGQNQKLTLHMKQLDALERKYEEVELQLEQFVALEQQLVDIDESITAYHDAMKQKQQELALLEGIEHHRELWITEQSIKQELDQLKEIGLLPASFSSEVESFVQERDALLQERRNIEQKRNELQHKIDHIHIEEQVIRYAPSIKRHAQAMPIIAEQQEQLKERRLELGNIEELLKELQERVPAYFSLDQILRLHISYEQREHFDRLLDERKGLLAKQAEQQFEYEQVVRQLRKNSGEINTLEQLKQDGLKQIDSYCEKKQLIPTNLAELQENRLLLQEAYRQFDYERLNGGTANRTGSSASRQSRKTASTRHKSASTKQSSLVPFAIAASVAALLFAICIVLMISHIEIPYETIMMPLLLISTLGVAIYAAYIKLAQGNNEKDVSDNRISGDSSLMMYRAMSNIIKLDKPIEFDDYYAFRESLQRDLLTYEEMLSELEGLNLSMKHNRQEQLTLEAEQYQIGVQLAAIEKKLDESHEAWLAFQQDLGLPVECTYEDFEAFLQIYRTIQHHEASIRTQQQYVEQLEGKIGAYYDELHALVAMDWNLHWNSQEAEGQFNELLSYVEEVQRQLDERERLLQQLEQLTQQLTDLEPAWSALDQRKRKLLELANVTSVEELSYTAAQQKHVEQLTKQYRTVELQRKLGMTDEQLQYVEKLLTEHNLEQLRQYRFMQQADYDETREKQKTLLEKKGSLRQQQEGLMSSEEQQRLLLERQQLRAQLNEELMQYVQIGMEKILLQKSKEKFEQERQPEVLLKAAQYFETLTSGAYTHLMNHTGKEALYLRLANGELMESESLSRGASELLYFCIRMACHDIGMEGRALPLILDDPCVNFDEERLESMLQLLTKVTKDRQIIYFTCHPHTLQKIEAVQSEVKSMTIEKLSLASV